MKSLRNSLKLIGLAAIVTILAGCSPIALPGRSPAQSPDSEDPARLTVLAAASLIDVFQEIGAAFSVANPGSEVIFSFAGSQQLAQQLNQGAPADLFASADEEQMAIVAQSSRIVGARVRRFAANRLTIVLPSDNPGSLFTIQDLAQPGIKLIVAAPEVPAGRYTEQFFVNAANDPELGSAWVNLVGENIVSLEPNVRAVLSKIALGEADGGIVYNSDLTNYFPQRVDNIQIPAELNVRATYPIAVVKDGDQKELAQRFIAFLFDPEVQAILRRHGFESVAPQ
jgi:molybdate transport system substrate-binding protein